jgi:hypothetical protein
MSFGDRPKPGEEVLLVSIPTGLLSNLPTEDQAVIAAVVGKSVRLMNYCNDGRAELQFTDAHGIIHFLYVETTNIKAIERDA